MSVNDTGKGADVLTAPSCKTQASNLSSEIGLRRNLTCNNLGAIRFVFGKHSKGSYSTVSGLRQGTSLVRTHLPFHGTDGLGIILGDRGTKINGIDGRERLIDSKVFLRKTSALA